MNKIMSFETDRGTIEITGTALIVGLDETGCEDYKDEKNPVFGLGGCAVLAMDYYQVIDGPWKEIKDSYFDGADKPLHAAKLRHPNEVQFNALDDFFTKLPFFRFACMSTKTFKNRTEQTNLHLVCLSIMNQLCKFVSLVRPTEIIFVIEASERIEKELQIYLTTYRYKNNEFDIPSQVLIADKKASISCVEVADFVVQPAGNHVRNRMIKKIDSNKPIRKDFDLVFNKIDQRLSSYYEMSAVTPVS